MVFPWLLGISSLNAKKTESSNANEYENSSSKPSIYSRSQDEQNSECDGTTRSFDSVRRWASHSHDDLTSTAVIEQISKSSKNYSQYSTRLSTLRSAPHYSHRHFLINAKKTQSSKVNEHENSPYKPFDPRWTEAWPCYSHCDFRHFNLPAMIKMKSDKEINPKNFSSRWTTTVRCVQVSLYWSTRHLMHVDEWRSSPDRWFHSIPKEEEEEEESLRRLKRWSEWTDVAKHSNTSKMIIIKPSFIRFASSF